MKTCTSLLEQQTVADCFSVFFTYGFSKMQENFLFSNTVYHYFSPTYILYHTYENYSGLLINFVCSFSIKKKKVIEKK